MKTYVHRRKPTEIEKKFLDKFAALIIEGTYQDLESN